MGGQPPAQEDLVVGEGALGVNDRSLRHCGKRQQGSVRVWPLAWHGERGRRERGSSGSRGVSVGEGAGEETWVGKTGPKGERSGQVLGREQEPELWSKSATTLFPSLGLSFLLTQMTASDQLRSEGPYKRRFSELGEAPERGRKGYWNPGKRALSRKGCERVRRG